MYYPKLHRKCGVLLGAGDNKTGLFCFNKSNRHVNRQENEGRYANTCNDNRGLPAGICALDEHPWFWNPHRG